MTTIILNSENRSALFAALNARGAGGLATVRLRRISRDNSAPATAAVAAAWPAGE